MTETNDMVRKVVRYLLMLILIALGVSYIGHDKLSTCDVVTLVMFVTVCFLFLDLYYPVVYCQPDPTPT